MILNIVRPINLSIKNGGFVGHRLSRNIYQIYGFSYRKMADMTEEDRLGNNVRINIWNQLTRRDLYTENTLGLERLQQHQATIPIKLKDDVEEYVTRLEKLIDSPDAKSITMYDLANLLGLAYSTRHLNLIEQIIAEFSRRKEVINHGWGTAVMRLYYILNQPERANKNLRDTETYNGLFNKKTSFRVAMTLLFNNERYQEVIEIYDMACERLVLTERDNSKQHPGLLILVFASYAKMNNAEALENFEKLYKQSDLNEFSNYLRMRISIFLIYLTVNNGKLTKAIDLISDSGIEGYITFRQLKIIALIKMNHYEELLTYLMKSLQTFERGTDLIVQEVYLLLESSLKHVKDSETRRKLTELTSEVKTSRLVGRASLDSLIFAGIDNQKNKITRLKNLESPQIKSLQRLNRMRQRSNFKVT